MSALPADVFAEIERQRGKWGEANANIPADRWMEIATDEYNDLRWAVRTTAEVQGHTVAKERAQLIAVLVRWADAETKEQAE
jgi:hypothetical protein